MSAISTYLEYIRSKIYAKDVRTAIVNAISQCYDDVNKPALQTEAMQAAVQAKIDAGEMAALTIADGSLTGAKLANGAVATAKIADGAITAGKLASDAVPTDTTLTQSGVPADAKAVGDMISSIEQGLSADAKAALLACFEHVAWIDNQGRNYYNALHDALFPSEAIYTFYDYISANGSGATTPSTDDGVIGTELYDNLNRATIALDYVASNGIPTSNLPIIGVRAENNWNKVVCIYITSGTNYTVYSHGSFVVNNAVVKGTQVHLELIHANQSPTVFIENGNRHEHEWASDLVVNAPLYLLANAIYGIAQPNLGLSNGLQIGRITIVHQNISDVYVPCVRNADNVIGIYNMRTNRFYTCSNASKATIGNTNCIYTVGNWT